MSLNIKSPRVHELARQAARVTGKSQSSAVEEALVRLLRAYDADPDAREREAKVARLIEIGRWFREQEPRVGEDDGRIRTIEDLYDEQTGLPT